MSELWKLTIKAAQEFNRAKAKKTQRAEDERRMEESDRRADELRIQFVSAGATRKR